MASCTLTDEKTGSEINLEMNGLTLQDSVFLLPVVSGQIAREEDYENVVKKYSAILNKQAFCIHTPTILIPEDGAKDVYGVFMSSPFSTISSYNGEHLASQWQIGIDSTFTNNLYDSGVSTDNLTSCLFNPILFSTTHYVRVRYFSAEFISNWSSVVTFESKATLVKAPEVTTNESATGTSLTPTFTTSAFSVLNGTDTLLSVSWMIAKDIGFNHTILEKTITDNPTILTLDTPLEIGVTYFIKARFNGQAFTSPWGTALMFKTVSNTEKPILTGSLGIVENTTTTVNVSNYKPSQTYTYSVSLGGCTFLDGIVTWKLPRVNGDTVAALTMTATDTVNGLNTSEVTVFAITVLDTPMLADNVITYNDTTIAASFLNTNLETDSNELQPVLGDIHDLYNKNTLDKIYVNTLMYNPKSGDVLKSDKGELFTVGSIGNDAVVPMIGIKVISGGLRHYACIKEDGYVYTVGDNTYGQLGLGNNDNSMAWVNTGIKAIHVVCGSYSTFIITENNELFATGLGTSGEFGSASEIRNTFLTCNINVKAVDISDRTTVIIDLNDNAMITGKNTYGQCSDGSVVTRYSWNNTNIKASKVFAGLHNIGCIDSTGITYTAGRNDYNQCGYANNGEDTSVKALNPLDVTCDTLAFGDAHLVIKKPDSTIWGIGRNDLGQVGLKHYDVVDVLTQTTYTAASIFSRGNYSALLTSDGKILTTGFSGNGETGKNSVNNTNDYSMVLSGAVALAGGYYGILMLTSTGTLYITGKNDLGQLGVNSKNTVMYLIPTLSLMQKIFTNVNTKPNTWITPLGSPLASPALKVYIQKHYGISLPVTQEAGENNFAQVYTSYTTERVVDVLNHDKLNAPDRLYIDNRLLDSAIGMWFITDYGQIFYAKNVGTDDAVISVYLDKEYFVTYYIIPDRELAKIPLAVYSITTVSYNEATPAPIDATYLNNVLVVTYDIADITPTQVVTTTVVIPSSNILTSLTEYLYKLK